MMPRPVKGSTQDAPRKAQVAGMVDSGMLQIEGLVPGGVTNIFKMPVQIYCFGAPDDGPAVRGLPVFDPGSYAITLTISQTASRRHLCLSLSVMRSFSAAPV
jgi:hypothetical protein